MSSDLLLEKEPSNLQAQSLGTLIERRAARGTYVFPIFHALTYTIRQKDISAWLSRGELPL